MRSAIKGIRVVGIVCVVLAVCVPLYSQTTTGRILGTIHDQSGAAVAGATVTAKDVQRATTRTATTDESGVYVIPALPPGTYAVRAEAKGFKAAERPASCWKSRKTWTSISRSHRAMSPKPSR